MVAPSPSVARGPGHRAGLTADGVVTAARQLLAEVGVEGLTMRALARRLDVAPNAVYSHVASKSALLDAVLDDVLGEVSAPTPEGDPVDGLIELMTSTYEVLTAHPDLVPLYLARHGARGPNALRLGGVMDTLLTRAGVGPADAAHARRVLIIQAIGSAAFGTSAPDEPAEDRLSAEDAKQTFSRSLRWVLTGIVSGETADGALG